MGRAGPAVGSPNASGSAVPSIRLANSTAGRESRPCDPHPHARIAPGRVPLARVGEKNLSGVILVLVAGIEVVPTRTAGLTQWKGSGFGMFSTTDRRALSVVTAPGRSEKIEPPDSLRNAARRAAALPADRQLSTLAARVLDREARHDRQVDRVRIHCWRTIFDRDTLGAPRQPPREFSDEVARGGASEREDASP
jgi:hypothetical protein